MRSLSHGRSSPACDGKGKKSEKNAPDHATGVAINCHVPSFLFSVVSWTDSALLRCRPSWTGPSGEAARPAFAHRVSSTLQTAQENTSR